MDHADHADLLRTGISGSGPVWADLGAGWGGFTFALADLLGPAGEIHAVDRDAWALRENARAMLVSFPEVSVTYQTADFTGPLELASVATILAKVERARRTLAQPNQTVVNSDALHWE